MRHPPNPVTGGEDVGHPANYGLHIYGDPVPQGMVATSIQVDGPPGLVTEDPILPPTSAFRLDALDLDLHVWSGTVDIAIPVYAVAELVSAMRQAMDA